MGQFGVLDILRSRGVYKDTANNMFALFEPDESVYDIIAELFSKNGFILCKPPREYRKATGESFRYRFGFILCSDRKTDLEWLNQFFPGQVEHVIPPSPAITPLPHSDGKLHAKWIVENLRAAVITDALISHARNPVDKHLFKLLTRAYYPTQRLPGDTMPDSVIRLRESTCHEVNSICTSWFEDSHATGIPTYNELLNKPKNYKIDRKSTTW